MKKFCVGFVFTIPFWAYGQSVIYKCTNSTGEISYTNTNNKTLNCTRTDLANPDKSSMIIRSDKLVKGVSPLNIIPGTPLVNNEDQQFRDNKRQLILTRELNEEQQQLDTVNNMLKNATAIKDNQQISQLTEMQQAHQHNINDLNKELGIKESPLNTEQTVKIEKKIIKKNLNSDISFNSASHEKDVKDVKKIQVAAPVLFPPTSLAPPANSVESSPKSNLTPEQFLLGK